MKVFLDREELVNILEEKFGKQTFTLFYTESDEEFEARSNVKIKYLDRVPDKQSYVLNLN